MSNQPNNEQTNSRMESRILFLFTRTPLHVGAGSSVGAIDQPVQRERHTGFPIIPASSLKGSFSDRWNMRNGDGKLKRSADGNWLFGVGSDSDACAGALQFSEARLLAFPIRSARGSFAWITCPLMLRRAARDGVIESGLLEKLNEPGDDQAIFDGGKGSKLEIGSQIVLEEYTFKHSNWLGLPKLSETMAGFFEDPIWKEIASRLVILSDGMMSFFAKNACEIAQHVKISDETGTAEGGALYNQENVPSETLFYSVLLALQERKTPQAGDPPRRSAGQALKDFDEKLRQEAVFQFGGDASTGLGYCTVKLAGRD